MVFRKLDPNANSGDLKKSKLTNEMLSDKMKRTHPDGAGSGSPPSLKFWFMCCGKGRCFFSCVCCRLVCLFLRDQLIMLSCCTNCGHLLCW